MTTIYVWTLVFWIYGTREPAMNVIDNITSVEECQRVQKVLSESHFRSRCIEIKKVIAK